MQGQAGPERSRERQETQNKVGPIRMKDLTVCDHGY